MSYGRTKEQFYEQALRNREMVADPKITECTCPDTLCEWHGKCKECVALHRIKGHHLPACLQPMMEDKIKDLLAAIELKTSKIELTSVDYRQYVRERDKGSKAK